MRAIDVKIDYLTLFCINRIYANIWINIVGKFYLIVAGTLQYFRKALSKFCHIHRVCSNCHCEFTLNGDRFGKCNSYALVHNCQAAVGDGLACLICDCHGTFRKIAGLNKL